MRRGRIRLPSTPSLCFRHGEYHVMNAKCFDWINRMAARHMYMEDEELRNFLHAATERRILDRFARHGHL